MDQDFEAAAVMAVSRMTERENAVFDLFLQEGEMPAEYIRMRLGWPNVVQVNAAVGRFGRKVYEILGRHPDATCADWKGYWHVVATGEATDLFGFIWTLRPEVLSALRVVRGYVPAPSD